MKLIKNITVLTFSIISSFSIASTVLNIDAPDDIIAEDLDSREQVNILEKHKGKIIYLDFWAHWCTSCSETFPVMQNLQNKYPDTVAVVAVAISDEDQRIDNINFVNKIMKDETPMFEILWNDGDLSDMFLQLHQWIGMPATFIIDPKGKIRYFHSGTLNLEAKMDELILSLIERKKSRGQPSTFDQRKVR
jgi:thiol-disulfide isomerase/thioredoxin